ncbi:MbtH family NRPS accessory protein [Micromonospora sp. B11E3]|uniref:MbtH family protein n=1 Tax=Micromonospora sp. B11E3 TaxID=3153562 RepID=UPI00325F618B
MFSDDEASRSYRVVVNHEEQYSIWPVDYDLPAGWRDAGRTGAKDECLEYVRQVWTDMRPLSLRQRHAEAGPGDRS